MQIYKECFFVGLFLEKKKKKKVVGRNGIVGTSPLVSFFFFLDNLMDGRVRFEHGILCLSRVL